jgi:hypothetical protein
MDTSNKRDLALRPLWQKSRCTTPLATWSPKTIFSYTLSSGGSVYFNGQTSYSGTIGYNLNGYTTYTVSWTVDLTATTSGNADFYQPFWLSNDMTIVTPSGGAPQN